MSRSQAIIIGVLLGFVALVLIGLTAVLFIPRHSLFPSPPTATLPPPPPTATPTFPNFMPTPSQETPTPAEPTPTNTRLPTLTPTQPKPPSPTVVINLPTRRPTDTPIPVPTSTPIPSPTVTAIPPTPVPRQYRISFEAEDSTITQGDCTNLKWEVTGASGLQLDRQEVSPSGKKEVCPGKDTEYRLSIQFPDRAEIQQRTVKIRVEEKE